MVYSPVNPWVFPVNKNFPWLPETNTIVSITNDQNAIITTGNNHGYNTGFLVRILFPFPYQLLFGMPQINEQTGIITVLSPNSFSININTVNYDPFVIKTNLQSPQVIPIGQYLNGDLNDAIQVNPPNNASLSSVKIFQNPGLQAPGTCNTSQT